MRKKQKSQSKVSSTVNLCVEPLGCDGHGGMAMDLPDSSTVQSRHQPSDAGSLRH